MKKILDFYHYVTYRIYMWSLKKEKDIPIGNTVLGKSGLDIMQIISVFAFITIILFPNNILVNRLYSKIILVFIFCIFNLINYLYYFKFKRMEKLVLKYQNEPKKTRKIKGWLVVLYHCLSLFSIFIVVFIKYKILK